MPERRDDPPVRERSFTYHQRQFWRESEQRWVDAVLISYAETKRHLTWRHAVVTETVKVSEWRPGR